MFQFISVFFFFSCEIIFVGTCLTQKTTVMKNGRSFHGFKTRQQIAAEYEISSKTLGFKLKTKDILLPPGRVGLRWQKTIYEALGYPLCVSKNDYSGV